MRIILLYILLALLGQQTTVNGQQTPFLESEKSLKISAAEPVSVAEPVEAPNDGVVPSTSSGTAYPRTVYCCSLSVDYYENQIRLADSLYKNYLPQYNFEEVKAAMEFFDSVQLSAISRQRRGLFDKKDTDENILIAESRLLTAAKAHYYHAVGLTERDDIVGACEHYFIALEIMETETENLKTSKSGKGSEPRAMSHEQKFRNAHSSKLEAQSPDYEKIRFLSLIYTRLGELFLSENYCDLAISKYRKALKYNLLLGENKAVANTYKCLGNSYQLYDMPDNALYYYNKSLATNSELPNRLDVEKCIAQILYDKGEKDSAYIMIKNNLGMIRNLSVKHSYYGTLGNMYYEDLEYDSAIFYFKKCVKSDITNIKHLSAIRLAAIHDSIGDYEKKMYYDNISLKLSEYNMNKGVERGEMQSVYNEYVKRKQERERLENKRKMSAVIMYFISVSFLLLITITFIIYVLKRKSDKYTNELNKNNDIINQINEEIKLKESEIKKLVEIIGNLKSDINSLKDDAAIKEEEISCKENDIKKMENDLSAKELELKKLQENVHENSILINRLNEDNIAKEKQIECYLEEIDDNRQVINDKNHLISIATEGLVARKDAIAENRNEIARLQAIIGKNEKVLNELSEDYKNNKEQIAVYLDEIEKLKTEINQAQVDIKDLRFKNSFTEGKIKKQNAELKKKEELIGKYTTEISNLKYRSERNHVDISNLNNYLQSDICSKILNDINEISDKKLKSNMLSPLSKKEFVLLLNSANHHLNNFINDMAKKYQKLKKEDLYYLCLVIMGLNNNQIASLFGVTYQASRKRKNKICVILGLDSKENLYNHLLYLI